MLGKKSKTDVNGKTLTIAKLLCGSYRGVAETKKILL